jgi:MFS family permease
LSASSPTFEVLIASLFILGFGQGAVAPLCFSVLGDHFPPVERSRWAGLMNIPAGIVALLGPTMSGWLVDHLSWRYIFGLAVPFILVSMVALVLGLPKLGRHASHKIDVLGSILLAAASGSMLLGLSWAGTAYAWSSLQVLGLLAVSAMVWGLFFLVETTAAEPMLDPRVLLNRTFLTASLSAFTSFFGLTAITAYYPLFIQSLAGASATLSGQIITPFSVLMAFMGVPAGLLLGRTRRYKWMYIGGYALPSAALFGLVGFTGRTSIIWGFAVTAAAGLGLGMFPTINALVAQYALPKRLLGAATGGIFFSVMLGRAFSPVLLGSAMESAYRNSLRENLPASLLGEMDPQTLRSLADPRVLLSEQAMQDLEATIHRTGNLGPPPYTQITQAIRESLESALRQVFLVGAITMLVSFLLVLTIPDHSLQREAPGRTDTIPISAQ